MLSLLIIQLLGKAEAEARLLAEEGAKTGKRGRAEG